MRLTFDFETRSACELKKAGAFKYSLDPSTIPTCLAWKSPVSKGTKLLTFEQINRQWDDLPKKFRQEWSGYLDEEYEFSAHNAFFERSIYTNILVKRYGWPMIPHQDYRCTAAKAAACALPRNLAGAGEAMKLSVQKDRRGYVAMMATCKPTKEWKAWEKKKLKECSDDADCEICIEEPPKFLEPEAAPEVWDTLYRYCVKDVEAEEALDKALPDLPPEELEIWHQNQRLNWRGLTIDVPLVRKILVIMEAESKARLKELDTLTMGLVSKPGAIKSILSFLELEGVKLPNLRAKTVEDKLEDFDLSPDMHRLLEIRKALSKTSTKKYQGFLDRVNDDGRVRDILMYHGASTGRDTGTGIQPHNFPRGVIKVSKDRPYAAIDNVLECDEDTLRLLYGPSLSMLFSSLLRNMIIPSPGWELFVADFSKIEVAVLWWLADNLPGLKILRSGKDPYIYMAAANTGRPYRDFNDESPERQLGKAQVLGCGFGMGIGGEKFQSTAWEMYRLKLTLTQSSNAVRQYREANPAVPELWKAYEAAAVAAIERGEGRPPVKTHQCEFDVKRGFLRIRLPSGRFLRYREPRLVWRETDYGPRRTIEFWAVNSKTKKWSIERTWGGTLTENIVQATARDLMMSAMVRLAKAGYRPLLNVHDEGICERRQGEGDLAEFIKILCEVPLWGRGLPIDAKGWVGPRYRK
jgi:DNA polymerase bacteriophage-type